MDNFIDLFSNQKAEIKSAGEFEKKLSETIKKVNQVKLNFKRHEKISFIDSTFSSYMYCFVRKKSCCKRSDFYSNG
jgi:hypothetical protein